MSSTSKYWEQWMQKKQSKKLNEDSFSNKENIGKKNGTFMSDRQCQITFLENQLERINQLNNNMQDFGNKYDVLQANFNHQEEKINNLTNLVKLQQEVDDERVNYPQEGKKNLLELSTKFNIQIDETKLALRRLENNKKTDELNIKEINERLQLLEEQKNNLFDKESTIESKHDMKNLASEVDIQMKEMETRLRTSFNKNYEIDAIRNTNYEQKIESKIDSISKDMQSRLESMENYQIRHNKNNNNNDTLNMTNQNEERLSEIEAKLRYKADINEIRKLTDKITEFTQTNNNSIKEVSDIAWNAEQACSRLTEDAFSKSDTNMQQLNELKNRMIENNENNGIKFEKIENMFKKKFKKSFNWMSEVQNTLKYHQESFMSYQNKLDLNKQYKTKISDEDHYHIELKMNTKVNNAIEKMGILMKKQVTNQKGIQKQIKQINERVDKVEDNSNVLNYIKKNTLSLDKFNDLKYNKKIATKNYRSTSNPKIKEKNTHEYFDKSSTENFSRQSNYSNDKSPRSHFLNARYNTIKTFENKQNNEYKKMKQDNDYYKKSNRNFSLREVKITKKDNSSLMRQTSPFTRKENEKQHSHSYDKINKNKKIISKISNSPKPKRCGNKKDSLLYHNKKHKKDIINERMNKLEKMQQELSSLQSPDDKINNSM